MNWDFHGDQPIYTQLVDQFTIAIVAGEFAPGEKLFSVRELAVQAGVNPNTMQRALTELERGHLVYTQRTNGRFVTEDVSAINDAKLHLARVNAHAFLQAMSRLGYTQQEAIDLLAKIKEEN